MGDVTNLGTSSYSFDNLAQKYHSFYAPAYKVKIDGTDIAGAGIIISSVSLDNSVEKADSFSMVFEFSFNMYTGFELDDKLQMGKEIQIDMGYIDKLETAFYGYITSVRLEISENMEARAVISGMDKSFKLMKGIKSRSFLKQKYSDIAQTIAGENGLSTVIDDTSIIYDYIEQAGISDYQLLSSLAEKSGSEFFVSGKKLYFRKLPQGGSACMSLKLGYTLLSVNLESDLADQVPGVIVTGWDRKKKEMVKGEASSPTAVGKGKNGVQFLQEISVTKKVAENYHSFIDAQDKATQLAKGRMQAISLNLISGTATCIGLPELRAGLYVDLEGLGSRFDTTYYIRSSNHTIDENGYYTVLNLGGNTA